MAEIPAGDKFLTIVNGAESEITIKGSRFIGLIHHVETVDEATAFLTKIKKQHHDATHHCSAYIVGLGREQVERFNDDGEPSGSAGRPILSVISGKKLTNLIAIVIRYYGGTKLGVGGLVRAYSEATTEALNNAKIIEQVITRNITLSFPYDLTGTVEHFVADLKVDVLKRNFNETPSIICAVPQSTISDITRQFRDLTRDKGSIEQ